MVKGLVAQLGSTPTCFPASVLSEDFQVPPRSGTPGTGPEAWAARSTGEVIYPECNPSQSTVPTPSPPKQSHWRVEVMGGVITSFNLK